MAEQNDKNDNLASSVLFNHLVLEMVLNYLEVSDLKLFRQVCKFWNRVGTPILAEKVDIALEESKLEQFLSLIPSSTHSFTMFKNLTLKINSRLSLNNTVTNMWSLISVHIKHMQLHVTTLYAKKELEFLLLLHLPCLVSLKLVITKYWGVSEMPHVIRSTLSQLTIIQANSNMESFHLSYLGSASFYGFNDGDTEDEFRFPINWKVFFRRYPQIKRIGFVGLNWMDTGEMLAALFTLQSEGLDPCLQHLEILDENLFPQSPNDEHLIQIGNLQNRLEAVHLEVSPLANVTLLASLLRNHSSSLKSVRLRRYPYYPGTLPIPINNFSLSSVKFFEVSEDLVSSLTFLPYMPSLKRFHIIIRDYRHLNSCEMICNTTNPSSIAHTGVKTVWIEPPLVSKRCIETLSKCVPMLETLKLRVNNEMLTEICGIASQNQVPGWKKLQNLHITSWEGLTDEGITGINDHSLKLWGEFPNNIELRNYRNKPFIGDLADLKTLTIEMWPDYDNHISDWSVLYGVLEVPCLQEVAFTRCGVTPSVFSTIPVLNKFMCN